jgi:hypothetical protein
MGVLWPAWWILLLSFLPWQWISTRVSRAAVPRRESARATAGQLAVVVALLVQQAVFSGLAIERAPMFSNYPMYASTWPSLEAYNASRAPVYRIIADTDRGRMELACTPSEALVTEFREAVGGSTEAAASVWRQLRGCGDPLTGAHGVVFEEHRRSFDPERMQFAVVGTGVTLGPLRAAAGTAGSGIR